MPKELSSIRERQSVGLREPPQSLMMQVHRSEKAIVGSYSYDIAVSRVKKAMRLARQEGFPLRLEYKEE